MPNRRCPGCDRRIPYAGRRCVHCGWTVGDAVEPAVRRVAWPRMLVALIVGLGMVGLAYRHAPLLADWYAGFAASHLPEEASSLAPSDTEDGAFFYCARQVAKKMDGEFSVETFPSRQDSQMREIASGRYQIVSFVEEARQDGDRVRYDFSCTVQFHRGRWVLQELQLTPQLAAR